MIGSRPRPGSMLVKDFAGNTLRSYTFAWKVSAAAAK
jgi:hypothetical protein